VLQEKCIIRLGYRTVCERCRRCLGTFADNTLRRPLRSYIALFLQLERPHSGTAVNKKLLTLFVLPRVQTGLEQLRESRDIGSHDEEVTRKSVYEREAMERGFDCL
jgi:hypothetical protein